MKSTLVILTRNEIEGVRTLFNKIPFDKFDECFVMDGGSTDGTVEFFKEKGIEVKSQSQRGRGQAFRQAFLAASGDILIFFSPDGNENPDDAPKLKEIIEQDYDMAIASRFSPQSKSDDSDSRIPYRS